MHRSWLSLFWFFIPKFYRSLVRSAAAGSNHLFACRVAYAVGVVDYSNVSRDLPHDPARGLGRHVHVCSR